MTQEQVLRRISHYDEATGVDISTTLNISPRQVHYFLAELVRRGLIEKLREGNKRPRYRVTDAGRQAL